MRLIWHDNHTSIKCSALKNEELVQPISTQSNKLRQDSRTATELPPGYRHRCCCERRSGVSAPAVSRMKFSHTKWVHKSFLFHCSLIDGFACKGWGYTPSQFLFLEATLHKKKKISHRHWGQLHGSSSGASTPYKRWSKCTMKKVGGSVLAEN